MLKISVLLSQIKPTRKQEDNSAVETVFSLEGKKLVYQCLRGLVIGHVVVGADTGREVYRDLRQWES